MPRGGAFPRKLCTPLSWDEEDKGRFGHKHFKFPRVASFVGLPSADLDCSLEEYVELICGIMDVPVHKSKIQSLHILFTLYLEFRNSQHFRSLAMNNELDNAQKNQGSSNEADHLILRD
ncbi:intraflagellar transport protein 46 homolog [Stegodyphus dumicola]|uniref:intraflagellar transport protein 46 homolog n=1 Tax=Stegodyphus dumicola TaxID=202533 RepID=UPI0015B07D2C|nr:intraflagellar transport protein 46 homolog [Stegodyphus dumicola]